MLVKQNDWATVWLKNYDDILSRFHLIPERCGRTDGHLLFNIARQYADAR